MGIVPKKSTYPTPWQFEGMKAHINTCDTVMTKVFKTEQFGFRLNHNFRWFIAQAITFYNFKTTLIKLPLDEAKIVTQIFLN